MFFLLCKLFVAAKKVLPKIDAKKEEKKPLPTDTKDGTHNRFGFKLRKNEATHVILTKQITFSRYVKFISKKKLYNYTCTAYSQNSMHNLISSFFIKII